jgi:multiple sugar transport system substrate-binding protein
LIVILGLISLSCSGPSKDTQTVQFWQFWSDINTRPVINKLISEFERENPGIKVKVTDLTWANGHDKLVISFAAHQPPDIMELGSDWIAEFASNDLLAECNGDSFPDNYLYPAKWDGKTYALPWLLDSRYLFFNMDLLQKAGMGLPRTWPELLEASKRIDSLGDDIFGFGCNSAEPHRLYKKFLPFLWSNGGDVLSADGMHSVLAAPAAIDALDFYLKLCDSGLIESQRRLEEYFRQGKIGAVISGGWLLGRLRKTPPDFQYKLAEFFTPDGKPGTSFFGGEYLALFAGSPKLEAARKLARFLTEKANSQKLCDAAGFGFPPYADLNISDPDARIEAAQLLNSKSSPPTPQWVDIEKDIEDAIEAAMYGHGSAAQILTTASKTIDAKLKSGAYATAK